MCREIELDPSICEDVCFWDGQPPALRHPHSAYRHAVARSMAVRDLAVQLVDQAGTNYMEYAVAERHAQTGSIAYALGQHDARNEICTDIRTCHVLHVIV